jgi:hypothetical protein
MRHDFGFSPGVPEWRTDDADLAMALELVPHLELDWHLSGKTNGNKHVTAWLLWRVRNALLERAS